MLNTQTNGTKPGGVSRFQTVPLYQQVREALLARISAGHWRPEQPIPNEGELAREYNVSSGTMRKALDALEAERVVDRRQGRGTYVLDKEAQDLDRIASCYCKVEKRATQARFESILLSAQPTEPLADFKFFIAQDLFQSGADFRVECSQASLAIARRTLLLIAHEKLMLAYLKQHPDAPPQDARIKTKEQARDHLLGRLPEAS